MLDLAVLSTGKYSGVNFSLFRLLIAKPTSSSAVEVDRRGLPITRLIRMVEAIVHDMEENQRQTHVQAEQKKLNKGERAGLRTALKTFKRYDVLTLHRYNQLLSLLQPQTKPRVGEGCGFDIHSLLLGANLFSLLMLRDGSIPTGGSRRKVPDRISCNPEVEWIYDHWWRRNRDTVAGSDSEHSRPLWLSRLQSETEQLGSHH